VARTYYPNGNLRREAYFQNGVQHGLTRSYYENGQLKSEEYYEQSRLEGPAKFYEPDGRLQWEAVFHKGQIVDSTLKNYTRAHSSSAQP
jgi:antitoxin component YwqK of YwqJK toxin-antitoxin module